MAATPVYSFTLPSLDDDTPLDCRIYHPRSLEKNARGAVLAHPYAPLGGSYDDHVVLSVTETLLEQGNVVATFNFRGAGDSAGKTSWTGRAEIEDYAAITGFLIYYLTALQSGIQTTETLSIIPSADERVPTPSQTADRPSSAQPIKLLLGGYSYGSLVLARLPPASAIITRFQAAPLGTAAAEIILRARTLASHTAQAAKEARTSARRPRGRTLSDERAGTTAPIRTKAPPVTMGGEETDAAERRPSRDSSGRSIDLVRKTVEVPRRVKAHIRRHSSAETKASSKRPVENRVRSIGMQQGAPMVDVRYLLISPVVMPFTTILLPPGSPSLAFTARKDSEDGSSGALFLQYPTLAVFGTNDAFTSSRRLRAWAEKQAGAPRRSFEWEQIQEAGHFWREDGAIDALQQRVASWTAAL